ncbi:MAG TPA: molecular chaperone HtpG [Candidatus Omnitrophica bacterium]|nr:MAG: molecular chaperone HtpG [Omnitrophica WOR_2 bacterium GWA2_45_18]HBR15075.1 molecular chaperone HtpG [Candidatus Omnitrophota bacterium]
MTDKKDTIQTFEYKAEMKRLLHLIIHSLYTHPEVFLRELISNASDALKKVRYQQLTEEGMIDKEKDLEIRIEVDETTQTFSIEDNGIGMTQEELIHNIGTVARSGTLEFLQKMKEEGKDTADFIGQFGVGFYSVFMVTEQVTVETRHAHKEAQGLRWVSGGEGNYSVEPIDKPGRGTKITFQFKEEAKEFAGESRIQETIRKYSNFADFPIFVNKVKVNTVEALWRKSEHEITPEEVNEFYKFITNDYEDPLGHLSLSIEGAEASYKALVFIPAKAPFDLMRTREHKTIQLYTNKIMIVDDCKELLPEYLQFIRGVVDTADLPLNVSREMVQSSPVLGKIKSGMTTKIIQWLQRLANKETEKYLLFYKTFGPVFKTGVNTDFANREKLIELLRFESSALKVGELTSFKEYGGRMKEKQKEIYYLTGDTREHVERNPNLEYFKKHAIEVLFLIDPVDVFVVPSIREYDKKPVRAIDQGDVDLEMGDGNKDKSDDSLSKSLIGLFKETLKDQVEDVKISRRLVDSAVTLVIGAQGMDRQMERMMKMMGQDVPASKRILEVNVDHPVIRNLARKYILNPSDMLLKKCITQLYESAQLMDGELASRSDYVKRMMEIMEEATKS